MKHLSPVMVFMAGVLWGTMGIFVRSMREYGLSSLDMVLIRAVVTSAVLFLYLLIADRKAFVIKLRDIWCFLGTGIASILFFNYCYFRTIQETSMAVAAVLLYTSPAFVMVMSAVLFREKLSPGKIAALIVTFAGCVCVSGMTSGGGSLNMMGLITGLGAGFGYALYSIFTRFALERGYGSLTITFYTFATAAAGGFFMTDLGRAAGLVGHDYRGILLCLLLGLVNTVMPYMLYTAGLKGMDNSLAAIIVSVEPVAATVLGYAVYSESLSIAELLGIILVMSGVLLSTLIKLKIN